MPADEELGSGDHRLGEKVQAAKALRYLASRVPLASQAPRCTNEANRYTLYILKTECAMRTRVSKWGNSLGVRIPNVVAIDAHLQEGAEVELTVRDGQLVIVPVLALAELVARITPENLPELSEDGPRGAEIW